MPLYDILLVLALARTGLGLIAIGFAPAGQRPWAALPQGAAEVCCALLLRTWFDPPFRVTLGGRIYPVFAFALLWSVAVWARYVWGFIDDSDDAPVPPSTLGTFGMSLSSGAMRLVAVVWHVFYVAPSLACGAFVVFGLVDEMPRH